MMRVAYSIELRLPSGRRSARLRSIRLAGRGHHQARGHGAGEGQDAAYRRVGRSMRGRYARQKPRRPLACRTNWASAPMIRPIASAG